MVISGEGMTTSLALRTKIPNKKQKARIAITDITNHDFRKFHEAFNNSPYLGYRKKQVHNEPTESYFFLINQFYKIIKSKKHVWIRIKAVKSDVDEKKRVNKTFGLFNRPIQSEITWMNDNKMENINLTIL